MDPDRSVQVFYDQIMSICQSFVSQEQKQVGVANHPWISNETLHLIEVQTGGHLSEDDIIRLEDTYGRT